VRDGVTPSLRSLLSPADGLEAASDLFSESPIEALDWLKELGDIARASIEPAPIVEPEAPAPLAATPEPATNAAEPKAPAAPEPEEKPAEESRLVEALLEYHRLRNPAVAARPKGRFAPGAHATRSEGSAPPTSHFAPMDIPVVKNVSPKSAGGRASQPVHSILQPKKRS
jgi:hypothetical protein